MPYGVEIEIDTRDVEREWLQGVEDLMNEVHQGTKAAIGIGATQARLSAAFQDRSGKLRASIRGVIKVAQTNRVRGELQAGVSPRARYASFVEEGTSPHTIEGNPLLTFKLPDGTWVSTRKVQHPGTRPMFFMRAGAAAADRTLTRAVDRAISRLKGRMEG